MATFLVRRSVHALPLLLLVSVVAFGLLHAAPGGPLEVYLANPNVRPEDIERLRVALGLDRPLPEQYLAWLRGFVTGEWGYSYSDGRPVIERIAERVPATVQLMGAAIGAALLVALPLGVLGALHRGRWVDGVTTTVSFAGISVPVFWLGLVMQLTFAVGLGWLPSSGRTDLTGGAALDRVRHLVLPAVVLAALHAATWSRYVRTSVVETLRERFVVAAEARGIARARVLARHVLGNALRPFVTVATMDAALMVTGAVVTESVFAWPGLGSLFTEALARRDYSVLMAFLMVTSVGVIVLNVLSDVLYGAIDPRVRLEWR